MSGTHRTFLSEVWNEVRPYAKAMTVDTAISASLWIILWVFHYLTQTLKINDNEAATWFDKVHSWGIVAALGIFGALFIVDIVLIRAGKKH